MITRQLEQFTDIYGYFVIIFTLHACLVLEGYDIILVPASNNRNYSGSQVCRVCVSVEVGWKLEL